MTFSTRDLPFPRVVVIGADERTLRYVWDAVVPTGRFSLVGSVDVDPDVRKWLADAIPVDPYRDLEAAEVVQPEIYYVGGPLDARLKWLREIRQVVSRRTCAIMTESLSGVDYLETAHAVDGLQSDGHLVQVNHPRWIGDRVRARLHAHGFGSITDVEANWYRHAAGPSAGADGSTTEGPPVGPTEHLLSLILATLDEPAVAEVSANVGRSTSEVNDTVTFSSRFRTAVTAIEIDTGRGATDSDSVGVRFTDRDGRSATLRLDAGARGSRHYVLELGGRRDGQSGTQLMSETLASSQQHDLVHLAECLRRAREGRPAGLPTRPFTPGSLEHAIDVASRSGAAGHGEWVSLLD